MCRPARGRSAMWLPLLFPLLWCRLTRELARPFHATRDGVVVLLPPPFLRRRSTPVPLPPFRCFRLRPSPSYPGYLASRLGPLLAIFPRCCGRRRRCGGLRQLLRLLMLARRQQQRRWRCICCPRHPAVFTVVLPVGWVPPPIPRAGVPARPAPRVQQPSPRGAEPAAVGGQAARGPPRRVPVRAKVLLALGAVVAGFGGSRCQHWCRRRRRQWYCHCRRGSLRRHRHCCCRPGCCSVPGSTISAARRVRSASLKEGCPVSRAAPSAVTAAAAYGWVRRRWHQRRLSFVLSMRRWRLLMVLFLPLPRPALLLLLRRRPLLLLRWPLPLRLLRRMLCVGCQRAQMLLLYPLYGSQTSALVRLCFTVSSWGGARVGGLLASR